MPGFWGEITGFPVLLFAVSKTPSLFPSVKEFQPPKAVQGPNRKKKRRGQHRFVPSLTALVPTNPCHKSHAGICTPTTSILVGAALPSKTGVRSFGMSICHTPPDPTAPCGVCFLEVPRQRCLASRLLITRVYC